MATILIVDDHPSNRKFLVTLLGYPGHRLLEASDGAEALERVRTEKPDLVIADILMPTMDGCEFVRRLHADAAIAKTPVVFYTATYHERQARELAGACGVQHVLTKPCRPDVILRMVEQVLGISSPLGQPANPEKVSADVYADIETLTCMVQELEAAKDRLSAIVALSRQLTLERDLVQVLRSYSEAARSIVGAKVAVIGLLNGNGQRLEHYVVAGLNAQTMTGFPPPAPQNAVLASVLSARQPIRIHDLCVEPEAAVLLPPELAQGSFLGLAIASSSQLYGFLYLVDKLGAGEFTDEDAQIASTLAAQVGVTYRGVRQYEAQRALQRERDQLLERLQLQLERMPIACITMEADFRIVDWNPAAERMFGFAKAEVVGKDPRDFLVPASAVPYVDRIRARLTAGDMAAHSVNENVTKDGRTILCEWHNTPLTSPNGQILGFMAMGQDITERHRAEQQVREYSERLQSLSRRLLEVQESERRFLARELHDEMGQVLTALQLALDMCASARAESLQTHLDEARNLARELLSRVRELSLELRPTMLDDLGLLPTLTWYFQRVKDRTGISVTFKHSLEKERFPTEVETAIYRIVQESLTNIARHAGVPEATVLLWAHPESLHVQIEDQGPGFDVHAAVAAGLTSGLSGMRERATLLRGQLTVESAPGAGTRITAVLPLRPTERGDKDGRDN